MMSERNNNVQLDQLIDGAVEDLLSAPDRKVLKRVKELTGDEETVAREFDRIMLPVLNQYKTGHGRGILAGSNGSLESKASTELRLDSIHHRLRALFSLPMRSVVAALTVVVAGATLTVPFWRAAEDTGSSGLDAEREATPRSVPKGTIDKRPVTPGRGGDPSYMAQLVKVATFSEAVEKLDLVKARYPSLFVNQSLVIRRDSGGAYVGGLGGLKSAEEAERICGSVRGSGAACQVVAIPKE